MGEAYLCTLTGPTKRYEAHHCHAEVLSFHSFPARLKYPSISNPSSASRFLFTSSANKDSNNLKSVPAAGLGKVVGLFSFPARNGSNAPRHLHHKPARSLSRGEDLRDCITFLGSKCHLKGGQHASSLPQKLTLSSFICRVSDSQSSEWEREEARWLREEKRWIREEERWVREEARWTAERKDLLEQTATYREQIKALKLEIAQLESLIEEEKSKDGTISDLIVSLTSLLQSLNMATPLGSDSQGSLFQAQISSSSSSVSTDIKTALGSTSLEIPISRVEMVKAVSQPTILEVKSAPTAPSASYKRSRTLKRGAEGDDVKALQEALAKVGFYSGDDDMEYSTFSSGTERAVRSWQATLGALEDGVVTAELLKALLGEETSAPSLKRPSTSSPQGNAAPSAKTTTPVSPSGTKGPDGKVRTSDVKVHTPVSPGPERATGKADSSSSKVVNTSSTRVYLLGENRWEEPDRLLSKNGPTAATAATPGLSERCFSCKGQGSMMCTECEGTGELNVEEQFLEWADEGAKCPYCEGKGVLDCDVCDGKGVTALA